MTPLQLAKAWAGALTAAQIRATVSPQDAVPPCVLFTPPDEVRFDLGCGGTAEMRALLLVPGPAQIEAWEQLERLLPRVTEALPTPPDSLRSTTYRVDESGPMPAYELTFTTVVDWSITP